jgi:hypothetical protein
MSLRKYLSLELERLPWIGGSALLFALIPSLVLLLPPSKKWVCPAAAPGAIADAATFDIQLKLKSGLGAISVSEAQSQISFSIDPPRPSSKSSTSRLMVRLNRSKQMERVELPCRLDLQFFDDGALQLSTERSLFWLEIEPQGQGLFKAALSFSDPTTGSVQVSDWTLSAQETPVQTAEEFTPATPFRELGEARWWGQDLFIEQYGAGGAIQRFDVGPIAHSHLVDLGPDQWLIYRNGEWNVASQLSEDERAPIARIRKTVSRGLEFEGWDGSSHVRLLVGQFPYGPIKTKGEELFSQLRVRSEKQISCTLDKQCLILRPADWVLKVDQRWKILRKKEEKEAFLNGELNGELFVLDRIEAKGAVKSIGGHYFSATRSQKAAIEYAVPSSKGAHGKGTSSKPGENLLHKSRGKSR